MEERTPVIRLENISKRFGGVQALSGVSFDIWCGEVHAIVGENGAGKSTLMNILAGIYQVDTGRVLLHGQDVRFKDPREAWQHRINVVFQELNLFHDLSVAANIFIGREEARAGGILAEAEMRRRARTVLDQMEVPVRVDELVGNLTVGQRQLVEIARALAHDAEIIIMDEPNSALTARETEALFAIINRLRSQGLTILYISHRLEEVFSIADRITVLHDGRHVGTWQTAETTIAQVVHAMTGGVSIKQGPARATACAGDVLLSVKGLSGGTSLRDLSLEARCGEVIGLAGLEGSGIVDFFHIIFGLEPKSQGEILVRGKPQVIRSPEQAIRLGIALVPANRRDEGLMMEWTLADNASLLVLDRLVRGGLLNTRAIDDLARRFVSQLRIATDSTSKKVIELSGGNQQKVAIAKWLAADSDILLLNDPARGIDVGAKAEIFSLVHELAARSKTVLLTSSDITEIVDVCDRELVFYKGRVCAEFSRGQASKQRVMETMMRGRCEDDVAKTEIQIGEP